MLVGTSGDDQSDTEKERCTHDEDSVVGVRSERIVRRGVMARRPKFESQVTPSFREDHLA